MFVMILMIIIVILLYKKKIGYKSINKKVEEFKNKPQEALERRLISGEISKTEYKDILEELKK